MTKGKYHRSNDQFQKIMKLSRDTKSILLPTKKKIYDMTKEEGTWSNHEQAQFQSGVIKHGWGSWRLISGIVKSRTNKQVKSYAQKFQKRHPNLKTYLMNEHSKMLRERKTKSSTKKKEVAEMVEDQDTTSTGRIVTQSTPHLKKRWLHKARNSIGIITPPSTIAVGSGAEVVTNAAVCSKERLSSENEKRPYDMGRSEKTCSHDGCYDIAKEGGLCMKHEEEDLLRHWFQTQFSGSHTS